MDNELLELLKKDKDKREEVKFFCIEVLKEIEKIENIHKKVERIEKSFSVSSNRCRTCGQKL